MCVCNNFYVIYIENIRPSIDITTHNIKKCARKNYILTSLLKKHMLTNAMNGDGNTSITRNLFSNPINKSLETLSTMTVKENIVLVLKYF